MKRVSLVTVSLFCSASLLLAGCSSSSESSSSDRDISIDIDNLPKLSEYIDKDMKTIDSYSNTLTTEDIEENKELFSIMDDADVYPQECTKISITGDPLPVETKFSRYSVLYGDTTVDIKVAELPDEETANVDLSKKCALAVIIGGDFKISSNVNSEADQQVVFGAGPSLAFSSYSKE